MASLPAAVKNGAFQRLEQFQGWCTVLKIVKSLELKVKNQIECVLTFNSQLLTLYMDFETAVSSDAEVIGCSGQAA